MRHKLIQSLGIAWTLFYALVIVWLYTTAPRSVGEIRTGASVVTGTYEVDNARFEAGRELFRHEQYRAARDEWERADPAKRDARVQFYSGYAFYREGWGRVYNDDTLFRAGLEAVERAISLSPNGVLAVDDPNLKIRTASELKAELQEGIERTWSDINPTKVFRERK